MFLSSDVLAFQAVDSLTIINGSYRFFLLLTQQLYFHTRKSMLNILNIVASSYIMEYYFGFSIQIYSPSSQNESQTVTGNTGHSSHP